MHLKGDDEEDEEEGMTYMTKYPPPWVGITKIYVSNKIFSIFIPKWKMMRMRKKRNLLQTQRNRKQSRPGVDDQGTCECLQLLMYLRMKLRWKYKYWEAEIKVNQGYIRALVNAFKCKCCFLFIMFICDLEYCLESNRVFMHQTILSSSSNQKSTQHF